MNHGNSFVVRKERCPECAKLGRDRNGDNLAIYSDGHTYCFSCGHGNRGTPRIPQKEEEKKPGNLIHLPSDVTTELPYEAKQWLNQYEISQLDTKRHLCMWSDWWSRLIFPYFLNGDLVAWQGRYIKVRENEPPMTEKWFTRGLKTKFVYPIGVKNREAVIVEDIISAIKVSRIKGAVPMLGSSLSSGQIVALKKVASRVWYWYDPNKRTESIADAKLGNLLGLETHVILSDKDPKEHSYEEIANYLAI